MAASPESISVHDRFFSQGSPVLFIALLILWCSLQASPFSLLSSNSRGSREEIATSEQSSARSRRLLGSVEEAAVQGACLPLLLFRFPFLNESWAGAGRAAAALSPLLWLRCLQCPLVTCSRCSHNSMKGGGRCQAAV